MDFQTILYFFSHLSESPELISIPMQQIFTNKQICISALYKFFERRKPTEIWSH